MTRIISFAATLVAGTVLLGPASIAAPKHAFSCYDYAWESQDQKDCLAGKGPQHKMGGRHERMGRHGMKGGMSKDMPRHDMPKRDMPMKDMPTNKS